MTDHKHEIMRWTPNDIGVLIKMVKEGKSASQIGHRLRRTRNAVIGQINRQGLSNPRPIAVKKDPPAETKRRAARRSAFAFGRTTLESDTLKNGPSLEADMKSVKPVDIEYKPERPVSFMELQSGHCRYMLNMALYCGDPQRECSSYCEYHHGICYSTPIGKIISAKQTSFGTVSAPQPEPVIHDVVEFMGAA